MEQLQNLWNMTTDVWQNGAFGVDVGKVTLAAVIFFTFLSFRKVFSRFVLVRLNAFASKTSFKHDDLVLKALKGPIRTLPVVLGLFFSTAYIGLEGGVQTFVENILRSLIIFMIFWSMHNLIAMLPEFAKGLSKIITKELTLWLVKLLKFFFIFIGVAAILEVWGIQVGPLIAGLGLFGVAVALGAQDLFKNLIAGILVIVERRFAIGDWVKIDGVVEGTVEHIGFRSTVVRRFDKAPVYVPNTKFSDQAITNFSAITHRRIYWKIGLEYKTTVPMLREIRDNIEKYIVNNDNFASPEEVSTFVRIDSFNDSSIDLMLYCFTKTTDWGEWLQIKEELAYKIKEIVENAGSGFAFPSQSIYVESLPDNAGDKIEKFNPPK